ncbi:MAG: VanZ family protein [Cyanobacteria bacterium P01_F01_bin.33]
MFDRVFYSRNIVRLLFVPAVVVIAAFALLPDIRLPPFLNWGKHSDLLYHVLAFLLLTAMAALSMRQVLPGVMAMALLAVVLECLQTFVPGREVFWSDLVASLAGVILGAMLAWLAIYPWRGRLRTARLT